MESTLLRRINKMKGKVTLIKTDIHGNDEVLFQENNMIVDGMRKQIADYLTHIPNTSSTSPEDWDMVSSYLHQAVSISPARDYFDQKDSMFWTASALTDTSAYTWSLLPTTTTNFPSVNHLFSGSRNNQYKYTDSKDFDISEWDVDSFRGGKFTTKTKPFGTGNRTVHRFEYDTGDARVVFRKKLNIKLGNEYRFVHEGKSSEGVTISMRIGRGGERPVEYYDFNTEKFVLGGAGKKTPAKEISLKSYFSSDDVHFVLKGNSIDQSLEKYTNYFLEVVTPSYAYEQEDFFQYRDNPNPFVEIVRVELFSGEDYILRNPNFLETQSKLLNNEFRFFNNFTEKEVPNPSECAQLGIVNFVGWENKSPLADQESPQDSLGKYGYARQYNELFSIKGEGQSYSGIVGTRGVLLSTSSVDPEQDGYAQISQTQFLSVDNEFASPGLDIRTNIDEAYGLEDANKSYILTFDVLAKGEDSDTIGDIDVVISRLKDGATYKVDTETNTRTYAWDSVRRASIPFPVTKNAWTKVFLPVVFDAESRGEYSVTIRANGRTNADGFIDYYIKDFCFGELEGWDLFPLNFSAIGAFNYDGSSNFNFNTNPIQFSAATTWDSNADYNAFSSTIVNPKRAGKQQIISRFGGLQPQKAYNIAVKYSNETQASAIDLTLKAFARPNKKRNLASNWLTWDSPGVWSGTGVSQLNPLSNDSIPGGAKVYYPKNVRAFESDATKANDTCIFKTGLTQNILRLTENFAVNANEFGSVSIESIQRDLDTSGYVSLGILQNVFGDKFYQYNWVDSKWDAITNNSDVDFGSSNPLSSLYYKPFYNDDRNSFKKTDLGVVPVREKDLGFVTKRTTKNNTTGIGNIGDYIVQARVYGPLGEPDKEIYFKNFRFDVDRSYRDVSDAYKQLYYDFENRSWSPGHKSYRLPINQTTETIENMHIYGLDEDTEYQLNIIDASGGVFSVNEVSLADITHTAGRTVNQFDLDKEKFTSEPWARKGYTDYRGFFFKQEDGQCLSLGGADYYLSALNQAGSYGYSSVAVLGGERLPAVDVNDNYNDVISASGYLGGRNSHQPVACFSFTPEEYGLSPRDKAYLQFTTALKTAATSSVDAFIFGIARDGDQFYSFAPEDNTWHKGFNFRAVSQSVSSQPSQNGDVWQSDAYNFQYISQEFTVPTISETATIMFGMYFEGINGTTTADALIKEAHLFRKLEKGEGYRVSGDSFLFPEFPRPEDETVQTAGASGTAGESGHLRNRINFFSTSSVVYANGISSIVLFNQPTAPTDAGDKSFFEAVNQGGYLPSAGMFFPSGSFGDSPAVTLTSALLNVYGAINHDGFIYRHPRLDPSGYIADEAKMGFIVSSYGQAGTLVSGTRIAIQIHKDDWKFIDYYNGGVGGFGLWSIDRAKSISKGLGPNFLFTTANATTISFGDGQPLYNHDYSLQPEFRLLAKKVAFPPGLHIDYDTTNYLTLLWDIDYI